jgi:hypothetical protein
MAVQVGPRATSQRVALIRPADTWSMEGCSRRLRDDALRHMADLGRDVAIVFRIPDFYDKLGFALCLVDSSVRVAQELAGTRRRC